MEPRLLSQELNMGMFSAYILDIKAHTRLTDSQVTGQRIGQSREAVINEFIEFRLKKIKNNQNMEYV